MEIDKNYILSEERLFDFWARVDKSGGPNACWPWQGAPSGHGYGAFRNGKGRRYRAHRLAWANTYGGWPTGFLCLHRCDNKMCCNPLHLFTGTQQDNMLDMAQKDRHVRGTRQPFSKLKESDIPKIRQLRKNGLSGAKIGKLFSVCDVTIYAILNNKTWKHL